MLCKKSRRVKRIIIIVLNRLKKTKKKKNQKNKHSKHKPQEARVLANNVHDVGCDDGFVVLASLCFAEAQQFLEERDRFFKFKKKKKKEKRKEKQTRNIFLTLMTVTKKRFSSSSLIAPLIEPMAQQSVLRFFHDHSDPSTCLFSLLVMMRSVSM